MEITSTGTDVHQSLAKSKMDGPVFQPQVFAPLFVETGFLKGRKIVMMEQTMDWVAN